MCFVIIAYGINFSKSKRTIANMIVAKGIVYIFLAGAIFVNVCGKGNVERDVTGLTLGIAIIEGSTALRDGIGKMKEFFENELR